MKTTAKKSAKYDDGLEWLREIRRKQAADSNNDPFEMGRRLREREKEFSGRIFTTKRVLVAVGQGAPRDGEDYSPARLRHSAWRWGPM